MKSAVELDEILKTTTVKTWHPFLPVACAVFKLNYSASDSADKNGVKNRLKKFISRRPSMKTLQEKGLIKGSALLSRKV